MCMQIKYSLYKYTQIQLNNYIHSYEYYYINKQANAFAYIKQSKRK